MREIDLQFLDGGSPLVRSTPVVSWSRHDVNNMRRSLLNYCTLSLVYRSLATNDENITSRNEGESHKYCLIKNYCVSVI